MMPVPSRPVPRVEHDVDLSSPDYSQYSDYSDGEQYYDEDEHYEAEEDGETGAEEYPQEGGDDMESNSDSSRTQTQQEDLSEEEIARIQHRTCVVKEILSTEESYLVGIKFVVSNYLVKIRELELLKPDLIKDIFVNIEDIVKVSEELTEQLKFRIVGWDESYGLSDIFSKSIETLAPIYSIYLAAHHKAIDLVNELVSKKGKFEQFTKSVRDLPESGGRDLLTFLITPVQRLLRYSLLFKDYVKHTPEDHPDHAGAVTILEKFDELAAEVNNNIKRDQNNKKLAEIVSNIANLPKDVKALILSPDHIFVREGFLNKVCRKTTMKRYFWLFTDMLMYGTSNPSGSFSYHRYFDIKTVKIFPLADKGEEIKNGFQIIAPEKSFTVMGDTADEKNFWLLDLGECINGKRTGKHEESTREYEKGIDETGSAPVWVPDKNATRCMICGEYFTVVRRRHHCRNCGKVICGSCSTAKRILSNIDGAKPERVCDFCDDFMKIQEMEAKGLSSSEGQQPLSLQPRSQKSHKSSLSSSSSEDKKRTGIFHKEKSSSSSNIPPMTENAPQSPPQQPLTASADDKKRAGIFHKERSNSNSSSLLTSNVAVTSDSSGTQSPQSNPMSPPQQPASGPVQRKVPPNVPQSKPLGKTTSLIGSAPVSRPRPPGTSVSGLSKSNVNNPNNPNNQNIVIMRKKVYASTAKTTFSAKTLPGVSSGSVMSSIHGGAPAAKGVNGGPVFGGVSPRSKMGPNGVRPGMDDKDREIERLRKELAETQNALKLEQEKSARLQAELDRLKQSPRPLPPGGPRTAKTTFGARPFPVLGSQRPLPSTGQNGKMNPNVPQQKI